MDPLFWFTRSMVTLYLELKWYTRDTWNQTAWLSPGWEGVASTTTLVQISHADSDLSRRQWHCWTLKSWILVSWCRCNPQIMLKVPQCIHIPSHFVGDVFVFWVVAWWFWSSPHPVFFDDFEELQALISRPSGVFSVEQEHVVVFFFVCLATLWYGGSD